SGLARSSRNAYLSAAGREQALALSRTLEAARAAAPSAAGIRDALAAAVARAEIDWDYAHALAPATLRPIGPAHRGEVLPTLAAARAGTRLVDAAGAAAAGPTC